MSIRRYLFVLAIITCLAWVSLGIVVFTIPPERGFLSLFAFYVAALVALTGFFTFPGFFVRYKFLHGSVPLRLLRTAFRQALLFSILLVFSFMLQGERYLTFLNAVLLVAGLVFLEFFFISKNPRHRGI